jgi:Ser/Thr protein kinase RdoA (MazF antagonist)
MNETTAARALFEHWALQGTIQSLPGERDRNFHVYTADGREFILKVAPGDDDPAALDLQDAAIAHLARQPARPPVPRLVAAIDGRTVVDFTVNGDTHAARLLTWLAGEPLALISPQTAPLLREVGASLGALTACLSSFVHPAARRTLKWDLAEAGWIRDHVGLLDDAARHRLVERAQDG